MARKLVKCTNELCFRFNVERIVTTEDNYCDYCGRKTLEVIEEIREISARSDINREYNLPNRLLEIKENISRFKLYNEEKQILLALIENYRGNKLHKTLILNYFDILYKNRDKIPFNVWDTLQKMADKDIIVYENDYFEVISEHVYNFLYEKIPDKFEQLIPEFYYLAPIDNIASIVEKGILSFNEAKNVHHVSIASEEVQLRREEKYALPLHDYANVYFAKKTPMYYVVRRDYSQDDLCVICVNNDILLIDGVYFTDGNAASSATKFYTDLKDLDKVFWDLFNTERCFVDDEEKRRKQAEVLVPHRIPPEKLQRIVAYDEKLLKRIKDQIDRDIPIFIDKSFYS